MLAIKNNLMAENAARHLGKSYDALAKSVERLSSGLRINSAKDDAAGLAVRELLRADVAVIQQGSRNAQDAISMLQTAEGAMGVIDDILIRMKELAEQASTGSYSDTQRNIMDAEYSQLASEMDRISNSTAFNSVQLLSTSATVNIHMGTSDTIDITAEKMLTSVLGGAGGIATGGGRQETQIHLRGVAAAGDEYLSAVEISGAGNKDHFKFKFSAGDTDVNVDFAAYDATGASLNQVVNTINTAWDAQIVSAEYVAFAYYHTSSNQYRLKLVNPTAETATFSVTATSGVDVLNNVADFTQATSGTAGATLTLTSTTSAQATLAKLTSAINAKDAYRAKLGYLMNRLEAAVSILNIQAENLMAAESRISDVDVATEMAAMTRNQVLSQAGISMLAQANMMPQMALTLLR